MVSRIYADIGFKGLWNGLPVRIVMIGMSSDPNAAIYANYQGTLTGLQWMIYGGLVQSPNSNF